VLDNGLSLLLCPNFLATSRASTPRVPTLGLPDFDGGDDGDDDDDDDVFVNVDFDVDVDVDVLGDEDADLLFISLSPLSLLNVAKPLLLYFLVFLSL
jgi:hypothetical protein